MGKDTEVRNSVECVERPQELVWLGQEAQGKGQQGRDGGAHGPHHVWGLKMPGHGLWMSPGR